MKFQMPPHSNLFDNLKNNNSEPRITNIQKSGAHLYQTTQANSYSSSSNTISNSNLITNTSINITSPQPTPIPILSSSTFNFSSIIESELVDSSSQDSSTKDIYTNSVSERDYLESCIEQMENNEIMHTYDILESMFDPIEIQNGLNSNNPNGLSKYNPSISSYNNVINNENRSLINFDNYSNNNQIYNQMTETTLNYNQIEIKQEKQDLDETHASYTAVMIPKTKTVKKNGKLVNEKHYGPIVVRPRKNPAPTLASGRKSKYAQLTAEEEYRREIRRRRNRLAAEKCKFKRNEIEEKLEIDLINLHNENHNLKGENEILLDKKMRLEKLLNEHTQTCSSGSDSNNTTNSNVTNIVIANIDYQANTQINYSLNHTNLSQLHAHNDNQSYFTNDSFNTSIYSNNNNSINTYPINQQQMIYDQQVMNSNQSQHSIQNFQTPQILANQQQFSRQNSHFQYNQYNRYV